MTSLINETKENALTEVEVEKENLPAMVAIEQSRAVQEVQAALVIAKKFPRDEVAAYSRIMKSCLRITLAEQAVYRLPIGGKTHEGPSIRLAEVLAQAWGNIKFGIKEISRENGKSNCIAYCWDQETNTSSEIEFTVEHWIEVGKAPAPKTKKAVTDPVEIDRLIANRGARKLRNCILNVIPGDIVEEAVKACKKTVANGGGEPLTDRIRKMVAAFQEISVSQQMLEERLKHPIEETTGEEIAELYAICKSIYDKQAKRSEFFNTGEVDKRESKLSEQVKAMNNEDTKS